MLSMEKLQCYMFSPSHGLLHVALCMRCEDCNAYQRASIWHKLSFFSLKETGGKPYTSSRESCSKPSYQSTQHKMEAVNSCIDVDILDVVS